jgi:hypothetical protein
MVWTVQDDRADLEEIASEYSDRIKVCKMDIDANQQDSAEVRHPRPFPH